MDRIRIFTDEDVFGSVARSLRDKRFDAVSTPEVGRLRASDEGQLEWSAQKGRVLVTFNVRDFARLHDDWQARARHHAGIFVSKRRAVGDLLRRIEALAAARTAAQMIDRLEYSSSWPPQA